MNLLNELWGATGLSQIEFSQVVMILIGLGLLYLAVRKGFEPLLLVPIGFGGILANIPGVDIAVNGGILYQFYTLGLETGVFPLLIFMGVGAMTDFGPLLANPKALRPCTNTPPPQSPQAVQEQEFLTHRLPLDHPHLQ